MKQVRERILGMENMEWKKLQWFQPKDLKKIKKENLDRLKKSLLQSGMLLPFHVWKQKDRTLILDGHIRTQAMAEMQKKGQKIPDVFPCVILDVKNEKEAARVVLAFNSRYADLSGESLEKWIRQNDLKKYLSSVVIPEVDIANPIVAPAVEKDHNPIKESFETYKNSDEKGIFFYFTDSEYAKMVESFRSVMKNEGLGSPAAALVFLCKNHA